MEIIYASTVFLYALFFIFEHFRFCYIKLIQTISIFYVCRSLDAVRDSYFLFYFSCEWKSRLRSISIYMLKPFGITFFISVHFTLFLIDLPGISIYILIYSKVYILFFHSSYTRPFLWCILCVDLLIYCI